MSGAENRVVNIDPGYITLSNVTLATTKDYQHRIYLGEGIYLENTLRFSAKTKSYEPYEWTYGDYRMAGAVEFFNKLRNIYREQLEIEI